MSIPMKTEKLYDTDASCKAFTATVISCEPSEERKGLYAVVLNKTAFFPERRAVRGHRYPAGVQEGL